jgi:hypothetical protein
MGQSQLLLLALALIVIGAAIATAIVMFGNSASDANRDAVLADLTTLSQRAQVYYRKPAILAGGGKSFTGLTADLNGLKKLVNTNATPWMNANGSYSVVSAGTSDRVVLKGVGQEPGNDPGSPVALTLEVFADSVRIITSGGSSVSN